MVWIMVYSRRLTGVASVDAAVDDESKLVSLPRMSPQCSLCWERLLVGFALGLNRVLRFVCMPTGLFARTRSSHGTGAAAAAVAQALSPRSATAGSAAGSGTLRHMSPLCDLDDAFCCRYPAPHRCCECVCLHVDIDVDVHVDADMCAYVMCMCSCMCRYQASRGSAAA